MNKKILLFFKFFFFINIFSMMNEDVNNLDLNKNKIESFEDFYKLYFDHIIPYDIFSLAEKRFAFISHYLEARNIGSLYFENEEYVDGIVKKKLLRKEIDCIKAFFLKTTGMLSFFDIYREKGNSQDNFENDEIYKAFQKVYSLLDKFPNKEERFAEKENLVFVLKDFDDYNIKKFQDNSFSDVHSSPEYFGQGFLKLGSEEYRKYGKDLEEGFKDLEEKIKPKVNATFFCGDLDDRDALGFLDETNKIVNFCCYNFFKDFFHIVHASWQVYCLCNNQRDKIKRFQVFGNHEEKFINLADKKGLFDYFSLMISSVRKDILSTETLFVLNNKELYTMSHGFFTNVFKKNIYEARIINDKFGIIFLKKNALILSRESIKKSLERIISDQNPALWSDYVDSKKTISFDQLFNKNSLKKDTNDVVGFREHRGYYNKATIEEALEMKKKIVLDGLRLFSKEFIDESTINSLENNFYAHQGGHTHNDKTLELGVKISHDNKLSFRNYYFENSKNMFSFYLCSCHNLYSGDYKHIFGKFAIKKKPSVLIPEFNRINTPLNVLEAENGLQWVIEEFKKKSICDLDGSIILFLRNFLSNYETLKKDIEYKPTESEKALYLLLEEKKEELKKFEKIENVALNQYSEQFIEDNKNLIEKDRGLIEKDKNVKKEGDNLNAFVDMVLEEQKKKSAEELKTKKTEKELEIKNQEEKIKDFVRFFPIEICIKSAGILSGISLTKNIFSLFPFENTKNLPNINKVIDQQKTTLKLTKQNIACAFLGGALLTGKKYYNYKKKLEKLKLERSNLLAEQIVE